MDNNSTKIKDLKYGLQKENELHQQFNQKFGVLKRTSHSAPFDYINNRFVIELKSRRCAINTHPTMMFNESKLRHACRHLQNGLRVIFIWSLFDNIWYWEMTTKNRYQLVIGTNVRVDRGEYEHAKVARISIQYLHLFKSFNAHIKTNI